MAPPTLKLNRRIWEDFSGNVCTNSNFFEMQLGDVWAGGQEQARVMPLDGLKQELVNLGRPFAEVEDAFAVQTRPIVGTAMDYAGNVSSQPLELGADVGALNASVEVEFGTDWTENYVFSAVPHRLHQFYHRDKAEKMFKWAVLNATSRTGPLFQREWFLVVEVHTSSRLVFMKSERCGKTTIQGRVEPPLPPEMGMAAKAIDLLTGLKLAQVGAGLTFGPEVVGLSRVVRETECACVVKVRNNRPLKPSRKIRKAGFFTTTEEVEMEERKLEEDVRGLEWSDDATLEALVSLDDAKLCEIYDPDRKPGAFASVDEFRS